MSSGSALLAVLWVVALLSMLIATTMLLVMEDVDTIGTRRQMFRARSLAEMGLAFAAHPDVKPDDTGLLHQEIGPGERFDVEVVGEDGRLNPNMLLMRNDRDTLRRVMQSWGLNLMQADTVIESLIDWVDQDNFRLPRGAEFREYNSPGLPFNRPFRSIEEMALVRGMREVEAVFPGWRDWFSIHAGAALDVNEAEPEIISAITGADIIIARQAQARRIGQDGIRNTLDDVLLPDVQSAMRLLGVPGNAEALAGVLSVQSNTKRIISRGTAGDFTKAIIAIVQGGPQTGGAASLLWLEE